MRPLSHAGSQEVLKKFCKYSSMGHSLCCGEEPTISFSIFSLLGYPDCPLSHCRYLTGGRCRECCLFTCSPAWHDGNYPCSSRKDVCRASLCRDGTYSTSVVSISIGAVWHDAGSTSPAERDSSCGVVPETKYPGLGDRSL